MAKKVISGVLWMARSVATTMGLTAMVAPTVWRASTALAAVPGDPFKLGKINTISRITQLVGTTDNAMLRIDNNFASASATALDLQVRQGKASMKVNSAVRVTNLNSDRLDGQNFSSKTYFVKNSVTGGGNGSVAGIGAL
jgi:hypothetical protein